MSKTVIRLSKLSKWCRMTKLMANLLLAVLFAALTPTVLATEPVPFLGQPDVLDITRYDVQHYAFSGQLVAYYSANRHKVFEEHFQAVLKKLESAVRATPPDAATLSALINIPEGPIESIKVDWSAKKGGETIDYVLDFTKYGHASVHPQHLLATIQYIGNIRREFESCPKITEAILHWCA